MNETLKYKILTFIRFLGDAFFWAFFSRFLVSSNYTNKFVGLLLSFTPLFSIILNPLYARFTKNVNHIKVVLGLTSFIEGLCILLIGFNFSKALVLILTILLGIFSCCHYGLMDSMVTVYAKTQNKKYTDIRIFGSIAYIIGTILGGFIANKSYIICFLISTILVYVAAILYFTLKKINYTEVEEKETISYKELLHNKSFMLFLIFYSITYATFYACDNFYSNFLDAKGITDLEWGFIYAYYVSFEVITLLLLNKFKPNINRMKMLLFAFGLFLVRIITFYLDLPLYIIIPISCLRGISYGIILYSFAPFVVYLIGKKKGPFGIMLIVLSYSIIYFGLSNLDGLLIDNFGYSIFYLVNIILIIIGIILGIILYRKYRYLKDQSEE